LLLAYEGLLSAGLTHPPCLLLAGFPSSPSDALSPIPDPIPGLPRLSGLPRILAQHYPTAAAHTATLGYVDQATLNLLYSGATALVFPSREEGFGLPVIEALACGCPVLTSTSVAVVEHLPSGFIATVPPGSSADLATAMIDLARGNPLTPQNARILGPAVAQKFSWDHTAELTFEALASIPRPPCNGASQ
jgi:glycosyltransferase involved in cell wall biosynthesis